ncbi:MAG: outer membrane protein [bacterium]|jgi:outer membrane protein
MKNIVIVIIAVLTFASCQQSQKIGFVDNAKLINEYQEKIDVQDKLQAKIKIYEQRRDSVRQAFQIEINEAELKSRKMSQENLQKLSQELQQKDQMMTQRDQFEQQQIAQESQAQNDSLIKKVKNFVKDYGTKNGYNFILGSNEAGSVMYGNEDSELTQTILDALNAAYKKD